MDIAFSGDPAACGVYRLEFFDWGGFGWMLYANCSGERTPGFEIFDNECDAIAAYNPGLLEIRTGAPFG